jgi:ATPase subunit of ABC transporter with duplicated ATPase domains
MIDRETVDDGEVKKSDDLKVGYISQELFWESADNTLEQEIHMSDMELYDLMHSFQSEKTHDPQLTEKIQHIDGFKRWDLQVELLKYF